VINFIEPLSREMGLKSKIEIGLWILGTNVMKDELMLERQVLFA
jgi:hypothetical protein